MSRPDVTIRPYPEAAAESNRRAPAAMIGAVCVLLGPVLLGVGLAVWPWNLAANDGAPNPTAIADSADRAVLAMNLAGLGCVCSLVAVLAMAALAVRQLPKTATWGALIAFVGLCAMLLYSVKDIPYVATEGVTPEAPLETWGVNYAEDMYTVVLYSLCPIVLIGIAILAVALWRSRAVPPWAAASVGLGTGVMLAAMLEIGTLAIPFIAIALIGAIPVARALLALPATSRRQAAGR